MFIVTTNGRLSMWLILIDNLILCVGVLCYRRDRTLKGKVGNLFVLIHVFEASYYLVLPPGWRLLQHRSWKLISKIALVCMERNNLLPPRLWLKKKRNIHILGLRCCLTHMFHPHCVSLLFRHWTVFETLKEKKHNLLWFFFLLINRGKKPCFLFSWIVPASKSLQLCNSFPFSWCTWQLSVAFFIKYKL